MNKQTEAILSEQDARVLARLLRQITREGGDRYLPPNAIAATNHLPLLDELKKCLLWLGKALVVANERQAESDCALCGAKREYQGWPNYETWAVKLWIDNEQPSQEYWFEQAQRAQREAPKADFVKRGIIKPEDEARITLARQLKDELEEEAPDLGASMYTDLLGAALGSVDWHRIAEALLEDLDEVGTDSDEEDNAEE